MLLPQPYPKNLGEQVETLLCWPFNWVRGLKQMACEWVKAPVNFLEVTWFLGPKDGWLAAQQDLHASNVLAQYYLFNPAKQNLLDTIHNFFAEIPLIGSFLDDPLPKDVSPECDAYFLLGGIHQISDHAQRMDPLELYLKEQLKTDRVYRIPWKHGTMLDVSFGTLNLSQGDALILGPDWR